MNKKSVVIIAKDALIKQKIDRILTSDYHVKHQKIAFVSQIPRIDNINIILCYIDSTTNSIFETFKTLPRHVESIPKIALMEESVDVELIRKCGEHGFLKVCLLTELNTLPEILKTVINKKGVKVSLDELNILIPPDNKLDLLRQSLKYIEDNYIEIKAIEDITNYFGISYKTLSCYFRNALLPNPKVILMHFKVRHALYLLKDNVYSNKEIAFLSGFTNEKRLAECFKRMFNITPGKCRSILMDNSVDYIWNEAFTFKNNV